MEAKALTFTHRTDVFADGTCGPIRAATDNDRGATQKARKKAQPYVGGDILSLFYGPHSQVSQTLRKFYPCGSPLQLRPNPLVFRRCNGCLGAQ
jgi:hypothetical protein